MGGTRFSVRVPSRIAPSCVSEPIGSPIPLRASSTPAMSVLVTAPSPTHRTPSLPSAGATEAGPVAVMAVSEGPEERRWPPVVPLPRIDSAGSS
jgi:hypothetical protein